MATPGRLPYMPPVRLIAEQRAMGDGYDPVLSKVRTALYACFGGRIERAVLYGSRARGDARPDSDYDIAVFLRDFASRWPEAKRLSVIAVELFDATGAAVHAMPFRAGAWRERSPLMGAIRRDGIDL